MFKKIITLFIALTMLLSILPISSAYAVGVDSVAGIMNAEIDSNSDKPMTREELARFAIQFTNATIISEGEARFIDIPEKHELFQIVNTVYLNGLMAGRTDKEFAPQANASVEDATRMLLSMLGYEQILSMNVVSNAQVNRIAKNSGLLNGIGSGNLTGRKLSRMIDNLGKAKTIDFIGMEDGNAALGGSGKTYLEILGYNMVVGQVNAVGRASISKYSPVADDQIMIDGNLYTYEGVDLVPYLGQKVRVITDQGADMGGYSKVLGIRLEGRDEDTEILAKDIVGYNDYQYTYWDEKDNIKKIKIDINTRIIFNGVNGVYDEEMMIPMDGNIIFRDTDNNGSNDLLIINSAMIFKVETFRNGRIISDGFTKQSFDMDEVKTDIISAGVIVSKDKVSAGQYLKIMPDKFTFTEVNGISIPSVAEATHIRVEIINAVEFNGSIVSLTEDTIKISREMEEGGLIRETYEYTAYTDKLVLAEYIETPEIGRDGTFVVDESGKIIDLFIDGKLSREKGLKYGYLLGIAESGTMNKSYKVRLVNESAQEVIIPLTEKFKINNETVTIDQLKTASRTLTSNTRLFNTDGTTRRQLVAYLLNSTGEIAKLYCAIDYTNQYIVDDNDALTETLNPDYRKTGYEGYDEDNFSYDYTIASYTYRNSFDMVRYFKDDTIIFQVPKNPNDIEKYVVSTTGSSGFIEYDSVVKKPKMYDLDENFGIGVLVLDYSFDQSAGDLGGGNVELTSNQSMMVVENVVQTYDSEKDEETGAFEYRNLATGGGVSDILTVSIGDGTLVDNDTRIYSGNPWGVRTLNDVRRGDIIKFYVDTENEISAFAIVFPYDQLYDEDGNPVLQRITSGMGYTYGGAVCRVISIDNKEGVIKATYGEDKTDWTKYVMLRMISATNIVLFTEKGGFEQISIDDVAIDDILFVRGSNGRTKDIVVYRK